MREVIDWINQNSTLFTLFFSFVVTAATVMYVILTRNLVRETVQLRKAETLPNVAIYLEQEERELNFYDIVMRNIGNGPAYDLSFIVETMPPKRDEIEQPISRLNFLKGVTYMAPGQEFRSFFGSGFELFNDPIPGPVNIVVTYKSNTGEQQSESFALDVGTFRGIMYGSAPPIYGIEEALRSIAKNLATATNGIEGRLKVDTKSHEEIRNEYRQRFGLDRATSENDSQEPSKRFSWYRRIPIFGTRSQRQDKSGQSNS